MNSSRLPSKCVLDRVEIGRPERKPTTPTRSLVTDALTGHQPRLSRVRIAIMAMKCARRSALRGGNLSTTLMLRSSSLLGCSAGRPGLSLARPFEPALQVDRHW